MAVSYTEYQIAKYIKELFLTKHFADVTIVCDDGVKILAHRLVLSAGSDIFHQILKESFEKHSYIHLPGIKNHVVTFILQFLYLGKVTSPSNDANELQIVAELLKLKNFTSGYEKIKQHRTKIVKTKLPVKGQVQQEQKEVGCQIQQQSDQVDLDLEKVVIKDIRSPTENKEIISQGIEPNSKSMTVSKASSIILNSLSKKTRKKKSYFCPECPYVCIDSSNLKRHIRCHHQITKVACDKCGESYNVDWIKAHKKTHSVRDKLVCPFDGCEKTYTNKTSLKGHVDQIHKEILHPCNLCDFQAVNKTALSYHKDMEHRKNSYSCNICDYKSFRKSAVKRHIKEVHFKKKQKIRVECSESGCEKFFARKHQLKVHIQVDHQGIVFPCSKCDRKFRSKDSLRGHFRTDHEREANEIRCSFCSYKSKMQKWLSLHIQVVHGTGIPCKVTNCSETFKSLTGLRDHKKTFHDGLSIQCSLCDFKAISSISLRNHKRIKHFNIKFKCNLDNCNESFTQKSSKRAHIRKHHKVIECTEPNCKSFFTERKNLERHVEYSHKLGKSSCISKKQVCTENNCERTFTNKRNLNMHIIKGHNVKRNNTNPSKNVGRPKGSQNIKQKIRITNLLTSLEEKLTWKKLNT